MSQSCLVDGPLLLGDYDYVSKWVTVSLLYFNGFHGINKSTRPNYIHGTTLILKHSTISTLLSAHLKCEHFVHCIDRTHISI